MADRGILENKKIGDKLFDKNNLSYTGKVLDKHVNRMGSQTWLLESHCNEYNFAVYVEQDYNEKVDGHYEHMCNIEFKTYDVAKQVFDGIKNSFIVLDSFLK